MPNGQDHDLLTQLNTKVGILCNTITELKDDIKEIKNKELPCAGQQEKCIAKMEELNTKVAKKISFTAFITTVVFLAGIVGSIMYYNFQLDNIQFDRIGRVVERVVKNEQIIKNIDKHLDEHIRDVNR